MSEEKHPTRDQIAAALWRVSLNPAVKVTWNGTPPWMLGYNLKLADAVLALFPQPTPSAELDVSVEVRASLAEYNACRAVPPSITNMTPGTTFWGRTSDGILSSLDRFWMVAKNGLVFSTESHLIDSDRIDPSTIRDLTIAKDAAS